MPARPRRIGRLGAGACVIVSHERHESLGAHVPDHTKRPRHVVEQFGHVLAEFAQQAAAFDARAGGVAGCGMLDDVARQPGRERTPRGLARIGHDWLDVACVLGLGLSDPLVEVGQRQLELLQLIAQLLR